MVTQMRIENSKMREILKTLLSKIMDLLLDPHGFNLMLATRSIIRNITKSIIIIRNHLMRLPMVTKMKIVNLKMREMLMMMSFKTMASPPDLPGLRRVLDTRKRVEMSHPMKLPMVIEMRIDNSKMREMVRTTLLLIMALPQDLHGLKRKLCTLRGAEMFHQTKLLTEIETKIDNSKMRETVRTTSLLIMVSLQDPHGPKCQSITDKEATFNYLRDLLRKLPMVMLKKILNSKMREMGKTMLSKTMDLHQDLPGSSFLMRNQLNHLIKLPTVTRKKILKSKMRETSMMMLFKTMDLLLEPAGFKLENQSKWTVFLKDTE